MADTTEREGFSLKIKSTIEFEFGSICDLMNNLGLQENQIDALKSKIRFHGNRAIRIIDNHLEFVNVSRNGAAEKIDPKRVISQSLDKFEKG